MFMTSRQDLQVALDAAHHAAAVQTACGRLQDAAISHLMADQYAAALKAMEES